MATSTTKTNKPINPRGNDQSPKGYNRAALYSGKALDFDGVNDYIVDQTIDVSSTSFAVSFYAKYSDHTAANSCGFSIGPSSSTGYDLVVYPFDGTLKTFRIYSQYNTDNIINDSSIPITGVFNHYVVQSDGTNLSVYANGVLAASVAYDNNRTFTRFQIGKLITGTQYYVGQLTNFKLFSTALTAAQVADLYNNPEKIVPTGVEDTALKLWLPMMEGAGTTAYDGSGNGNHGTISGATYVNGVGAPVAQTAVMDWNKGTNRSEYSEDLSQTAWAKTNISVSASATTAPDGSTNAWNAVPDTSNNIHLVQDGGYSVSSGNYYVASGWFKANGYDYALISYSGYGNWGGSNGAEIKFDLVNGTATPTGGAPHGYGIVEYPNGWYRCYTIGLANSTFSTNVNFFASDDGTSAAFVGDGTSGVLMWGLHSFISSEIGPYIPTLSTAQTSDVLLPQGLTTGRDITGVNLFENVRKQGALNLDGNSWAEVHDNASVDLTTNFSLEVWCYPTEDGHIAGRELIGKFISSGVPYQCWVIEYKPNQFNFAIGATDNTFSGIASTTGKTKENWYHVVATYDGANRKIYVNGVAENSEAFTKTPQTTDKNIAIGRWLGQAVGGTNTFFGPIAQPRIYNRALTAEEVERNYNAGKNTYKN